MKVIYVIRSYRGGFWSTWYSEYKGWLYAEKFDSDKGSEIRKAIVEAAKREPCEIVKFYI
jgi:hypothetical protein